MALYITRTVNIIVIAEQSLITELHADEISMNSGFKEFKRNLEDKFIASPSHELSRDFTMEITFENSEKTNVTELNFQ